MHLGRDRRRRSRGTPPGPGAALRSGESGATNRSSPHQTTTRDQSTSGPGREPGQLAVDGLGDGAAGERDLRLVPAGLGVRQPGQQLAGDRGRERVRGLVHLDPGRAAGRGHSDLLLVSVLRHGGVDVVLVEAAQLLGEQLVHLAAAQGDRPVGWPGEEYVASRPSGRAMRIGPSAVSISTAVMPGPLDVLRATSTLSRLRSHAVSRSALGFTRSAETVAAGDLERVLVERRGQQRPPRRQPGPGEVGVARRVGLALVAQRGRPCRGSRWRSR